MESSEQPLQSAPRPRDADGAHQTPDAYWRSLQLFNGYRTAAALLLLMAASVWGATLQFGSRDMRMFLIGSGAYAVFALAAAADLSEAAATRAQAEASKAASKEATAREKELARLRREAEREAKEQAREEARAARERESLTREILRSTTRVVSSRSGQDLLRGVFGTLFGGGRRR